MPDEVQEVTGHTFTIPKWVISLAEDLVLAFAPLEINWVKRGTWGLQDAFNFIEKKVTL